MEVLSSLDGHDCCRRTRSTRCSAQRPSVEVRLQDCWLPVLCWGCHSYLNLRFCICRHSCFLLLCGRNERASTLWPGATALPDHCNDCIRWHWVRGLLLLWIVRSITRFRLRRATHQEDLLRHCNPGNSCHCNAYYPCINPVCLHLFHH